MSLFGDVAPSSPQSTTKPQQRGGSGFDSIFVRLPMICVKLMGTGFMGFFRVVFESTKKRKVYYTSGPSWRKWPW